MKFYDAYSLYKALNEYRGDDKFHLRHAHLSGLFLKGYNFNGFDLRYANLSRCILIECKFNGCELNYVNFSESQIESCDFVNSNMIHCNYERAYISDSSFECSDLFKAKVDGIVCDIDFQDAWSKHNGPCDFA